jgi:hypothetical protein
VTISLGYKCARLAFIDFCQFVIYHTKESNDDVFGSHRVVLLSAWVSIMTQASHNLLAFSTLLLATSNIG